MRLRGSLTIIVYVGLLSGPGFTLAQEGSAGSPNSQRPPHRQEGFIDYAMGKINPENRDVGAQLHADRTALVEQSINNLYFWSNLFTLSLLFLTTGLLFLERRAMWKKELIASTLLTELWNGRISDRIEIQRRTRQYKDRKSVV